MRQIFVNLMKEFQVLNLTKDNPRPPDKHQFCEGNKTKKKQNQWPEVLFFDKTRKQRIDPAIQSQVVTVSRRPTFEHRYRSLSLTRLGSNNVWSCGLYKVYNFIVWDSCSYELSPIVAAETGNAFYVHIMFCYCAIVFPWILRAFLGDIALTIFQFQLKIKIQLNQIQAQILLFIIKPQFHSYLRSKATNQH